MPQYVESSHLVIITKKYHTDSFSLPLFADLDYHHLVVLSDVALERESGEEYQQDGGVQGGGQERAADHR